ncbi:pilus assembly protein PilO [Aerosakkonemataceae cyanobacterium BLCC-F154]|uniref:Pilus assembly protein PilO n=1 Tax=Floridaenema fluviatile BLCC-F154 TaxID=3153640 RepID=A0ABV4Y679_9CYAN
MNGDFTFDGSEQQTTENGGSTSLFGIQLTPPVIGALIAVLGLGAAGYLFYQFVMPVMQRNDELRADLAQKESELQAQKNFPELMQKAVADRNEAKQQRNAVATLFGNEQSVKTLLLDLNKRIEARNSNLKPEDIKAKLTKFDPDPGASGIVNDGAFGAQANNQIYRQVYEVEMQGTFDQTRLFLLDLERQKNLLVANNFKTLLDGSFQKIVIDQQQGQIVPIGKPATSITTSFKLNMLRPLTEEEQKSVQPPASGTEGTPSPGATPSP